MPGDQQIKNGSIINWSNGDYSGWPEQDTGFREAYNRGAGLAFYHVPTQKFYNFRAYINRLSENYSANWSSEKTIGRMDEIQKYSNTTRKISISFDIPAESEADAVYNFGMLGRLIKFQYPTYDTVEGRANSMNNPPLIRLKFGNIIGKAGSTPNSPASIGGLLGAMSGLNWNNKEDFGYFNPYPGEFYPRFFTISFDFTAIHEHDLGWNSQAKTEGSYEFERFPYNVHVGGETGHDRIVREVTEIYNDTSTAIENTINNSMQAGTNWAKKVNK